MKEESKLKIEKAEKDSEQEGKLESIEEDTTPKVKQGENSEHEGTFENRENKMKRTEITIPVFNGEDHSMCNKRITMYLKMKKV